MRLLLLAPALLLTGCMASGFSCRPMEPSASEADMRELRAGQAAMRDDLAAMMQWAQDRSRTDDLRIQSLWKILDRLQRAHGMAPEPLPEGVR